MTNINEILADELVEDMKNLQQSILSFEDRWKSHLAAGDFIKKISPEKRKIIYKEFDKFKKTMDFGRNKQ